MRRLLLAVTLVGTLAVLAGVAPTPSGAVVGGREADAGEWPGQVALLVDGGISCGGTLVAPDVVLTAAHCTDGVPPSAFEVVGGTIDLRRGGQRRGVDEVDQHEDYDPVAITSDIALLYLDRPFDLDDDLAVVTLATREEAAAAGEAGAPATVTGFGERSEEGDTSGVLLEGELEVYADDRCEALYGEDGDVVRGESQICAGRERGHVDACYGDSGGPLMVPVGDGWRQVGIVSWGSGCGVPDRPTIYTEVPAFADWLDERGVGPEGATLAAGEGARIPARGTLGKASRYPLTVEVDGFEGALASISVELLGLSHRRASDLDVWLVAPDGTTVAVLSDAGGDTELADADLLIVDGVTGGGGSPLSGTLGPTDREADRQRRDARSEDSLSAFAGIDPNGTWQLLVADDRRGATGSLDGWNLQLR